MTHLCVAITVKDPDQAKRDIALAAEAGADLIELRVDHFTGAEPLLTVLSHSPLPCIVTCRPIWEGGQSELDDDQRVQLLQALADSGASYIDMEFRSSALSKIAQSLGQSPREKRPGLIVSAHDFVGRPERLENLLQALNDSDADVVKLVWTARSIRDNFEAFEILQHRHKPTIALCMGEAGILSRLLAKKFGAFLTFAALHDGAGTAAGQVSVADMKRLYRFDAIGPGTRMYGVVASPVMHSMSPAIHNAAFDATGFDGVYAPLLVEGSYESFKAFMESALAMPALNFAGASITIPHKQNALRWLQSRGAAVEELAARIGAVNTIAIDHQNGVATPRGLNTDYAAILDSITTRLNISRNDLRNYRVAVLGAGGTGRTAVAALAHYGATVTIHNRTRDKADALAREFNGQSGIVTSADLHDWSASPSQIFINTTSIGMYPNVNESPFADHPPAIGPDTLVFDTVYNPMRTRLLEFAQAQGAMTIGGIEMFVRQAATQFQTWTGLPAPLDVMRQIIEQRLSTRTT